MVTCIKRGYGGEETYFIARVDAGRGSAVVTGGRRLVCGEVIEYDESAGTATPVEGAENGKELLSNKVASYRQDVITGRPYETGNAEIDAATARMWGKLEEVAWLIVRKMVVSAPILVRFHNDADGAGGAYALYLSLKELSERLGLAGNCIWTMHRSVSYRREDCMADILTSNAYACTEKPLALMIDFGTNPDSNGGIECAVDRFDVAWLDHHPLVEGFGGYGIKDYVNTWQFGSGSEYTAGLLCAAMCKCFSKVDTSEIEGASLIGDYSRHAGAAGAELSALLDFLTSDLQAVYGPSKANITPQEIDAIVKDRERSSEMLRYAQIRMDEALDRGMAAVKLSAVKEFTIATLDFEDVRHEDSKYPLPGRYSSKLLDRIEGSGAVKACLVVSVGQYLLIRLGSGICGRIGVDALVEFMKSGYPDIVEGGGGHRCAGSIKLKDKEASAEMAGALVKEVRNRLAA